MRSRKAAVLAFLMAVAGAGGAILIMPLRIVE
jgi:hypothetical protein